MEEVNKIMFQNVVECKFNVFNFSIFINFQFLDFMTYVRHISWIYIFLYFKWSFQKCKSSFHPSLTHSVFSCNGKMCFGKIFCWLSEIFLQELFSLLTTDMFLLLTLCYVDKYYLWLIIWIGAKIAWIDLQLSFLWHSNMYFLYYSYMPYRWEILEWLKYSCCLVEIGL